MSSRHWEKLWHEIIDDIKLGPLPAELKWRFVQLIVLAGIVGEGGLLPELPDMAFRLRLTEEQLRSDLPTLARRELVELTADGRWLVTNYAKRQAAMSSTERVQRHRAKSYPQARSSSSSSASSSPSLSEEEEIEEEEEAEADNVSRSGTDRFTAVSTARLLDTAGIARNRTTTPLWKMDPEYVAAHLAAADSNGLAIRRMLDGDPEPRHWSGHSYLRLRSDYEDIIRR